MLNAFTAKKRFRSYGLTLSVLGFAFIAGTFIWYRTQANNAGENLQTIAVARGDIENTITAVGVLQPSSYVDVGAQVSGQLKTLNVQIGESVQQGQLLAEIDPRVYLAKVQEAKATLDNLRAQFKIKKAQLVLKSKQLIRHEELYSQDAFALSEVEISEASLATAKAEVEAISAQINQAEATLETAKVNLGYTKITAPMSGTVVSITTREGQTLNANQQTPIILRIADMDLMTVWTQVSEADVLRLRQDQEAYFTVLGQPEKRWKGRLQQVLPTPEIINNVIFYNALFNVENPKHELRVQMTAQVFFILERSQKALLVPVSAILSPDSKPGGKRTSESPAGSKNAAGARPTSTYTARVLRPDGTTEDRQIKVGVVSPVYAEILSGLEEGEMVVIGTGPASPKNTAGGLGTGTGRGRL
ncbi:MAG: efflux RND transporter periplasmic adaptor subunit [Syntrophales bacterium]|jgi:macrolide-specific efflux system membrane fusion protein|nr:efflux RND transporter periplasmic adaptor subunit [Syntrophales bacterium]